MGERPARESGDEPVAAPESPPAEPMEPNVPAEPGSASAAPCAYQPGTSQPGTSQPGTSQPGTGPGGTGQAGAGAESDRAQLAARLDQCQARHLRTLADFDNYRRRAARELERAREEERDRVILEWLPVLDHLEHALTNAEGDPTTFAEGVHEVRELALSTLRRFGVSRVDETSVPFDPARHEVAAVAGSGRPRPGRVIGILRPGYVAQGRLLRPAAVAVSMEAPGHDEEG